MAVNLNYDICTGFKLKSKVGAWESDNETQYTLPHAEGILYILVILAGSLVEGAYCEHILFSPVCPEQSPGEGCKKIWRSVIEVHFVIYIYRLYF